MYHCEICGAVADIHHIIHRHQGGYDLELNYKYLCDYHHRGKTGPHNCIETDLKYKIELQNKLFNLLPKDFYTAKELFKLLNMTSSSFKRLTKKLKCFKEGYSKIEVIKTLLGGHFYSESLLTELQL